MQKLTSPKPLAQTPNKTRTIVRISTVLCIVSFGSAVVSGLSYLHERHLRLQTALDTAEAEADRAVSLVEERLKDIERAVDTLSTEISSGEIGKLELDDRLRQTLDNNPNFTSVGVAFEPYAFDPNLRLYAPVFKRLASDLETAIATSEPSEFTIQRFAVSEVNDYTDRKAVWYQVPMREGAGWISPYISSVTQDLLAEYLSPFTLPGTREPQGVVYANYNADRLKALMNSLDLQTTGYGFLIAPDTGQYIYHPISSYVTDRISIFDEADTLDDPRLRAIARNATAGQSGIGKRGGVSPSWIVYRPVPSTGWSLGIVVFRDEIFGDLTALNRHLLRTLVGGVLGVVFLLVVLIPPSGSRPLQLWLLSLTSAVTFAIGIGGIWLLEMRKIAQDSSGSLTVTNPARLQKFRIQQTIRARQEEVAPPVFVPTGVFVQSLEFTDANDVFLTGYIWQQYRNGIHDNISRGFVLPESIDPSISQVYRQELDEGELIGWYFEARLRQPFEYKKFPFDRKDVWIRLWHQDFSQNVVLVPDFDAYTSLDPTELPGLEHGENFVLPGWWLERSFFKYQRNSYNVNFGFKNETQLKDFPELYFDIVMRRNFVTAFITTMMPILVVSLLLFGVHYLSHYDRDEYDDRISFSASGALSASGAFTFILILDQINLRSNLATGGILYIEYFYFVLYLAILAVSLNALLVAGNSKQFLLRYHNNLIPKVLYWPLLLALKLIVTVVVFY